MEFEEVPPKVKYSPDALKKLQHNFLVDRDALLGTDMSNYVMDTLRKEILAKYGPLAFIDSVVTTEEWSITDDNAKFIVTLYVPRSNDGTTPPSSS